MATLFGRYEYAGELGRGATGRVFLVRDLAEAGERRAVKVVPREHAARLIWEFARLCQVESARIARVRELVRSEEDAAAPFGLAAGTLLLVEDFVEGAPLSSTIVQVESASERVELGLRVALGLGEALTALHELSLVHGDVKPDNVLTDARGERATLIDLGFARPRALVEVPRGTPAYMAPELLAGMCTPAADVYAVGALLYDCIRGEEASAGSSRVDAPERRRLLEAIEPLAPAPVVRLLGRLLASDLSVRPSDGATLLAELAPVAAEVGIAQAPLGVAPLSFARSAAQRRERAMTLPFVGHERLLREAVEALTREPLVVVRGARGAGRSRFARETIRTLQEQMAARGERVPTFVRTLDALASLRAVDAILWLDEEQLAERLRAAELARLTLPSLRVLAVCGPEQHVEGARAIDVPPLDDRAFQQLLSKLLEPERATRELVQAARAASAGLAGRLCGVLAAIFRDQRDARDPRSYLAVATEGTAGVLPPHARKLALALAWWGSALSPEVATALLGGAPALARAYDALREQALLVESDTALALAPAFARRLREESADGRAQIAREVRAHGGQVQSAFAALAAGELESARARFFGEASALCARGELDEASALLREAEHYLTGRDLRLLRADIERARGRHADGLEALVGLEDDQATLLRIELLRLLDRAVEARALLQTVTASADPAVVARARALEARLTFDGGELRAARALADALTTTGDREAEVRALEVSVLARLYTGEPADVALRELIERAAPRSGQAARSFLRRAPARALALRAQLLNGRGERTRALADLREAAERMRDLGEVHEAATYMLNLGLLELESGELGPALETLQEAAQRLARTLRHGELARVLYNFALAAQLVGDFDRARAVLVQAERELAVAPDALVAASLALVRADLALARGALESAEQIVQDALAAVPPDLPAFAATCHARQAQIAALRGSVARAEAALTSARDVAGDTLPHELLTAELRVALASGDGDRAEAAVERGLATFGSESSPFGERLRFLLASIEAAKQRAGTPLGELLVRERTALTRSLLERALATLPRELRAKMRAVPAYERVLAAEASAERPASERDATRWRALVRASRRLFSERGTARIVRRVVEIALELVQAERALAITFREGGALSVTARAELSSEGERLGFSRSVVERVALEGHSLLTIEARSDERLHSAESVQALHVRSVLCVELHGGGERTFLYLDDRLRPAAFSSDDLALVEDLAELARQALRAGEQIQRESRRARRAEQRQKLLTRELTRSARGSLAPSHLPLLGDSAALASVISTARRVALSEAPVLITGESGTGKELLARLVHESSPRRGRAFVAESCASLPDTLLESALFGHVRGAFTGAERAHKGLFEVADGGTLLLDEVGEMSPSLQSKLLRVLQEGELRPLGSERTRSVDVRVIAATRRDLTQLVAQGTFREDLYYRLAVVTLHLPPLRERREDIAVLVSHFVEKHARGKRVRIHAAALRALEERPWPGNVRELENEIRRALALCEGEIEPVHLSGEAGEEPAIGQELDLHARSEALTRELVREALRRADGNVTRAATLLGLSRFGLQKILKRLQLPAK